MTKKCSCVICGKNTLIIGGWHLDGNLDFCSDACVAKYIEITLKDLLKRFLQHEKRIRKLEQVVK